VGRRNVGKSALFNRIMGQRRAIVGGEPGIARGRMLDGNMKIERDVTVRLGGRTLEEGPNICVKQRRDRAAWRFLR